MGDQAFRQAKYSKLELRDQYDGHWKTDLTGAIGAAPLCKYRAGGSACVWWRGQ